MPRKFPVSLNALARELGVTVDSVKRVCRQHDAELAGPKRWVHDRDPPLRVQLGLAETIRGWHRDGRFEPASRFGNQRQRDAVLVEHLYADAERVNSCVSGFGSELEVMVSTLRRLEVDPLSARGRRLLWQGWRAVARRKDDYERWQACAQCLASFRPVVDRAYVDAFVDGHCKRRRDMRKADGRVYDCLDCGGMRYTDRVPTAVD